MQKIELAGQKFGRLTVMHLNPGKSKSGDRLWTCICDCGKEKTETTSHLKRGYTKSCGCLLRESRLRNKYGFKHGDAISRLVHPSPARLYTIWLGMKMRCLNPNDKSYRHYGGQGISVCHKWQTNYIAFKNWALNHGYQSNLTIDRIDSKAGYTPINCRWLTKADNSRESAIRNWGHCRKDVKTGQFLSGGADCGAIEPEEIEEEEDEYRQK